MIGIVQSIHHKWAELIYQNTKRWELRKTEPRNKAFLAQPRRPVYIYEPEAKAVTGTYWLGQIARWDAPEIVAQYQIGLDEDEIIEYGPGRDGVFRLWGVSSAVEFAEPLPLSAFGLERPPQSWCYVEVSEK